MVFKNILLTGGTGIIGQHVLFELLHDFESKKINGIVHLVIRSKEEQSALERIKTILTGSFIPDYLKQYDVNTLLKYIKVYDVDLTSPKINKALTLSKEDNICVIHCAASTNLISSEEVEKEIKFNNYHATLNLLNVCANFATKFCFVSTAFACGIRTGFVNEDYLSYEQDNYRNPYERTKAIVERAVVKTCEEKNMLCQILRPSIVCGRLFDSPLFFTPKFNVFYGYTKFFHKLVDTPFATTSLRIAANPETAILNVVPVDYVAKAMTRAIHDNNITQINLTLSKGVPLKSSFKKMVEVSGYTNYTVVNKIPDNMNMLEALYYSKVGNIATPYLNDDTYILDTTNVRSIMTDIQEPDIEQFADEILGFAKAKGFSYQP
jgi:thioester reductase-like protein